MRAARRRQMGAGARSASAVSAASFLLVAPSLLIAPSLLVACTGQQSALEPAGRAASRLADLFWGMTVGAVVIWLVVVGLALYATYFARGPLSPKHGRRLIVGGGVVFPTMVLTGLLVYGLSMLPDLLAPAPQAALKIQVTGHQWWWRVRYPREHGAPIELANEIHLPVNRPVEFELEASDVIHSFWIPSLGGKVDMIPGRRTRLVLEPTEVGVYRGVCAEYCGASHALMSFFVVVEPEDDFERWLAKQAEPAASPPGQAARQGEEVLIASGCGACHSVRGTPADGAIGPDLTHVGSRRSIGAGVLETEGAAFLRWISRTNAIKPSVHMPEFGMLPDEDQRALAAYLEGLR